MDKFEYLAATLPDCMTSTEFNNALNGYAGLGWRLVCFRGMVAIFERRVTASG